MSVQYVLRGPFNTQRTGFVMVTFLYFSTREISTLLYMSVQPEKPTPFGFQARPPCTVHSPSSLTLNVMFEINLRKYLHWLKYTKNA